MNKPVALILSATAVLGMLYMAFLGGVQIREWTLIHQCNEAGGVSLWQSSGPGDWRRDGMLPFHCEQPEI